MKNDFPPNYFATNVFIDAKNYSDDYSGSMKSDNVDCCMADKNLQR